MLLGNYQVLNRSPGRFLGGPSLSGSRSNWNGGGAQRNMAWGESAEPSQLTSKPNGTEPPYSWMIAQRGGALAAQTTMAGVGDVTTGNLALGLACSASLAAFGDIASASLSLVVALAGGLTASGTLNTPSLQLPQGLSAALSGSGDLVSTLQAIGHLVAALTGSGALAAEMRGTAALGAAIASTGDLLTTANVADAVWDVLAAAHNQAGTMGELLNNGAAGGGPSAASIADAVWDEQASGHVQAGSMGLLQARLDAAVSSLVGQGLTGPQITMLQELYRLLGLDPTTPLVVNLNTNQRTAGAGITQTIVDASSITTVTRI